MTPGARIQLSIELLETVDATVPPVEPAIGSFLRARRFVGSKDRRSISDRIYRILRRRYRLQWWLARTAWAGATTPRVRVLADLILHPEEAEAGLDDLFSGKDREPEKLSAEEQTLIRALSGKSLVDPGMPDDVALEYPAWLDGSLRRAFGDRLQTEMRALNAAAAVDLRANSALTDRDGALAALADEGIEAEPMPISPVGLRLKGRANLKASKAFRQGLIEIQDGGSQIVALLAGAEPGMTVVDFCAGSGGKTLALGADMMAQGEIDAALWACDVEERFLNRLIDRAERACLKPVRRHVLKQDIDPWLRDMENKADRVMVDAPCSGTGTWRRHPASKWWLTPERLAGFTDRQREILKNAAILVKPGGRLIYATCSTLAEENEDRIEEFLTDHPAFRMVPVEVAWSETLPAPCPANGNTLRLSPAITGTDAFFCAILERAA